MPNAIKKNPPVKANLLPPLIAVRINLRLKQLMDTIMNSIKNYASRSLWISAIMFTALLAGCGSDSNNNSSDNGSVAAALTVTSTAPADAADLVPLNSKVIAYFSETMDATAIDGFSFTVAGDTGPALTGAVSTDANSSSVTFTPSAPGFTADTPYTATITAAAKSLSGKSLANDYVWQFRSGIAADTDAPTVVSTDPTDAATGFALNRNIDVVFSETLDPASVNSDSFTLTMGGTAVQGTVSYSNKLVTFQPANNLAASTIYTATLTTAVTDLATNALAADYSWTFETGDTIATGPEPVNLRTAGDFVILTKTGITNVFQSAITGNIGASPITATAMNNVSCDEMTGIIYGADDAYVASAGGRACFAGTAPDNTLVANAVLDMGTAYNDAAGRTTPDFTELHAGDVSGKTLVPGLYKWGTNVLINTDVTLAGGANDVWIFQIAGDVLQASNTQVLLSGGAVAENVFWQVGGGTGVVLDTGASFKGIVIAEKGVTVKTGATVNGRLLSQTAVTLEMNTVTAP